MWQAGLEKNLHGLRPEHGRPQEGCIGTEKKQNYLRSVTILEGVLEFIGKIEVGVGKESQKLGK